MILQLTNPWEISLLGQKMLSLSVPVQVLTLANFTGLAWLIILPKQLEHHLRFTSTEFTVCELA